MSAAYRIRDEPTGSRSHALIVNPFWPLLAMMLAGAWLSGLMYGCNAVLLRGPTWRRELALIVLMLLGAPLLFIGLAITEQQQWLPIAALRYLSLSWILWKLAMAYWLFFLQQNTFALYEYFGGTAQESQRGSPGMVLVVVGMLVNSTVETAFNTPLWRVMVN